MPNETADDFIIAAELDMEVLESLKYFDFKSANMSCFHAQQYAEKMIKAKLIQMGIQPSRSHDLVRLLDGLEDISDFDTIAEYCSILSNYEAQVRYPSDKMLILSPEDAELAYEMASEIPYLLGIYSRDKVSIVKNRKMRTFFSRFRSKLRRTRYSLSPTLDFVSDFIFVRPLLYI